MCITIHNTHRDNGSHNLLYWTELQLWLPTKYTIYIIRSISCIVMATVFIFTVRLQPLLGTEQKRKLKLQKGEGKKRNLYTILYTVA